MSQTLIIHMIRTSKLPFIESKSSKELLISTIVIIIITMIISFTDISTIFDLRKLPPIFMLYIFALMLIYIAFIQTYKRIYIRNNKEWL